MDTPSPSPDDGALRPIEAHGVPGRISVIIPAYNYAHFLGACLGSVLSQRIGDLEIVVVDDGSEDDTAEVARAFKGITYIRQHNQGLSAARNTGIHASSGEFLLFLDADDLLAANSLAPRREFLQRHPEATIGVCRNRLFTAVSADGSPHLGSWWRLPPTALDLRLLYFNIAPPHAYLLRRQVVAATGLFDTTLRACEDYDYWLRSLALGYAPIWCPAGSVLYRKHRGSMSADSANQLHHDVLLHARVFELLLHRQCLPVANALAALLAAYAGLFTTLGRLPATSSQDRAHLLQTVDASLPRLAAFAAGRPHAYDLLAHLFLLYLKAQLRGPTGAIAPGRGETVLHAMADTFGLPLHRDPACYRSAALSLVSDQHAPFIDRYRVSLLIAKRLFAPRWAAA